MECALVRRFLAIGFSSTSIIKIDLSQNSDVKVIVQASDGYRKSPLLPSATFLPPLEARSFIRVVEAISSVSCAPSTYCSTSPLISLTFGKAVCRNDRFNLQHMSC